MSDDLLHRALKLCLKAHKGQDRDGEAPLPYATHPVDVMNKLRYIGGVTDTAMLAAALLHDVLEETEVKPATIAKKFGEEVLSLVVELTREEPDPATRFDYSEEEWYELRSRMLLAGVEKMSRQAQAVKLADRLSNLEGARATRNGLALQRYVSQTELILQAISRTVNPALWDAVRDLRETML